MNYSKTHQDFARRLDNQDALTNPEQYLGPNYRTVLDFWWFLEGLSKDQWGKVAHRYREIPGAARLAARNAAWNAARLAARNVAWYVAWYVAWDAAGCAAGYAAWELIGMHILLEQGKTLTFLPLFNDL